MPTSRLPQAVEEIYLTAEDDVRLQAYLLENKASTKLLIYFHGNAGNLSHRVDDLLKLKSFDLYILCISYRGYGKSEGRPGEKGVYLDGAAALNYAREKLGYSEENIYLLGRSIGSTVAIHTAQYKKLAGLILVSPLTNAKEQARAFGYYFLSFLAMGSFDNTGKVENVTCPVLIVHGDRDKVIPVSMGKAIFDGVTGPKEFVEIKGAGHNNLSSRFSWAYWQAIGDFIKK